MYIHLCIEASGYRFSRKSTAAVSVSLRCQRKRECSPRSIDSSGSRLSRKRGWSIVLSRSGFGKCETRADVSSMVPQTPCRLRFSYQNSITTLLQLPRTESPCISHSELVLMSRDCSSPPSSGDNCARSLIISKFPGKLPFSFEHRNVAACS